MNKKFIKILLIDDDEDDFIVTRDLLAEIEGEKFELEWHSDFDKGWEAAKTGRYDVFLIDFHLGGKDGVELLRKMKDHGIAAPAILLTGEKDLEIDIQAMQAGAADYLIKGEIDSALLERSIRYSLQRKQIEESLAQAEKLKSAQELAGAISHEFSQPLQILSLSLNLLRQKPYDTKNLDICERMVQRITELVDNLRNITSLEKLSYLNSEILDIQASARNGGKFENSEILIVDDEEDIAQTLVNTLQLDGYLCDSARDGYEALQLTKQKQYNIIISDINMPRMPGTTLFNQLKAMNYSCYFIFMTGYAVSGEIQDTIKRADKIFQKPFPLNDLLSYVKTIA